MIGYVTLGTDNFENAAAYYDALLAELGAKRAMEMGDRFIAWGNSPSAPMLGITRPFNNEPATFGNGTMVALAADSPASVDRIYKKAIELGGKDEGAAGPRGDSGFYAGYFRDLDNNKLCVFCIAS